MGLFKFLKSQMLKVIEWNDMTNDTIAYRFKVPDRYEIMKGSRLVVRESQLAIFVQEGKIADIFSAGTHKLDTNNLPILTAISNWVYAFESKFKGDVYFINTTQFTNRKWGTTNPVIMRDADFGVIRLRGHGIYSFRANNPEKLLKQLFGTRPSLRTGDIEGHLKKAIISKLSDAIAESKIPALDLSMHYDELSALAKSILDKDFEEFGLELSTFYIENLSLPEEVEKTLDTRTQLGVLGDKMGTFTQYQAAKAMRESANNPSGGIAGAGVGLGAGLGMGKLFTDALSNVKDEEKPKAKTHSKCSKCGEPIDDKAKFCAACGEKVNVNTCPKCGHSLRKNAKFCPECGEKIVKSCPACGAEASGKFCPDCGEKL